MINENKITVEQWRALAQANCLQMEVVSESMIPQFYIGDQVLVTALSKNSPSKGDVVVFFRPENTPSLTVHRCCGKMRFRGDNALTYDVGVTEEDLVGIVKFFIRDGEKKSVLKKAPFSLKLTLVRLKIQMRTMLSKLKRKVIK